MDHAAVVSKARTAPPALRLPRGFLRNLACGLAVSLSGLLLDASSPWAQAVIAYPEQGQSPDQQSRDRYECHLWAVQQSGVDPTQQQATPVPPPPSAGPPGGALQGATRGAALGAVGGAIGGNAGKGAAIGAGTGALFGAMRRNEQQQQAYRQQQYQAQQSGSSSPQRATYNLALKTCLQGRGYTVG